MLCDKTTAANRTTNLTILPLKTDFISSLCANITSQRRELLQQLKKLHTFCPVSLCKDTHNKEKKQILSFFFAISHLMKGKNHNFGDQKKRDFYVRQGIVFGRK